MGRALIPRLRELCEDLHASNQGSSPFLLLSCGQAQGLHGEGPGPQEQGCCMVLGRRGGILGIQRMPVEVLIKTLSAEKGTHHEQQVWPSECRPMARADCPGEERPDLVTVALSEDRKPLWIKWEGLAQRPQEGDNKRRTVHFSWDLTKCSHQNGFQNGLGSPVGPWKRRQLCTSLCG